MDNATSAVNATAMPMSLPLEAGSPILTTLGYLCLILGIIFLGFYLLRKFGFQGVNIAGGTHAPKLISRLMLGNRQSVAVVRYREKDLVIGVTEEQITLLKEYDADEDEKPAPGAFAKILKRRTDDEE